MARLLQPLVLQPDVASALRAVYDRHCGPGHFDLMLACLGRPPKSTTLRCNTFRLARGEIKERLEEELRRIYAGRGSEPPPVLESDVLDDLLVIPCSGSFGCA